MLALRDVPFDTETLEPDEDFNSKVSIFAEKRNNSSIDFIDKWIDVEPPFIVII